MSVVVREILRYTNYQIVIVNEARQVKKWRCAVMHADLLSLPSIIDSGCVNHYTRKCISNSKLRKACIAYYVFYVIGRVFRVVYQLIFTFNSLSVSFSKIKESIKKKINSVY